MIKTDSVKPPLVSKWKFDQSRVMRENLEFLGWKKSLKLLENRSKHFKNCSKKIIQIGKKFEAIFGTRLCKNRSKNARNDQKLSQLSKKSFFKFQSFKVLCKNV